MVSDKRPVNVCVLVTEQTLEEKLLKTISQKKELAMAAPDYESVCRSAGQANGVSPVGRFVLRSSAAYVVALYTLYLVRR